MCGGGLPPGKTVNARARVPVEEEVGVGGCSGHLGRGGRGAAGDWCARQFANLSIRQLVDLLGSWRIGRGAGAARVISRERAGGAGRCSG